MSGIDGIGQPNQAPSIEQIVGGELSGVPGDSTPAEVETQPFDPEAGLERTAGAIASNRFGSQLLEGLVQSKLPDAAQARFGIQQASPVESQEASSEVATGGIYKEIEDDPTWGSLTPSQQQRILKAFQGNARFRQLASGDAKDRDAAKAILLTAARRPDRFDIVLAAVPQAARLFRSEGYQNAPESVRRQIRDVLVQHGAPGIGPLATLVGSEEFAKLSAGTQAKMLGQMAESANASDALERLTPEITERAENVDKRARAAAKLAKGDIDDLTDEELALLPPEVRTLKNKWGDDDVRSREALVALLKSEHGGDLVKAFERLPIKDRDEIYSVLIHEQGLIESAPGSEEAQQVTDIMKNLDPQTAKTFLKRLSHAVQDEVEDPNLAGAIAKVFSVDVEAGGATVSLDPTPLVEALEKKGNNAYTKLLREATEEYKKKIGEG